MKKKNLIIPVIFASLLLGGCSSEYVPPKYDDDDYGYMLDTFYGMDGTLKVEKDQTTVKLGEEEFTLLPTKIKKDEISYEIEAVNDDNEKYTKTVTENVISIYYGKKRNKESYKVTLTASELKFVELQKEIEGQYEAISLFTVEAPYLAGMYNGYGEFDYSEKNNCLVIGDELQYIEGAKLPGYQTNSFFLGTYMETNTIAVPGIYLLPNDTIIKSCDFLDLSDGLFYEFVLYPHLDGNLYSIIDGNLYYGFFADPTMYLTTIVDEEGSTYENGFTIEYDSETGAAKGITASINGEDAEFLKYRDEDGIHFFFTLSGGRQIEVRSHVDHFEFKDGETTHNYAPLSTGYELSYSEANLINGDSTKRITYFIDTDWDTWEEFNVFKFNDVDVANLKTYASKEGRAVTSFKAGGVDYLLSRISDYIGQLSYGNDVEYVFDKEHFSEVYNHSFANPASGLSIEVADFHYSINGGTSANGQLFIDNELNTVGFKMGDYSLYVLDSEEGIYVTFTGQTGQYLVLKDKLDAFEGTYTSDGTDVLKYQAGKIYVGDTEAQYSIAPIEINDGYKYAFIIGGNYYLVPNFEGAIDLYVVNGESLQYSCSYVDAKAFSDFVGLYTATGDYGAEHIEFTADGKLYLDTPNGQGGLIKEQYNYAFSSKDGAFTINALVEREGVTYAVPFIKTKFSLVLEAAEIFYIDDRLYELQGAYGDGTSNTIYFIEESIYINSTAQTIKSIEKENNVTTIKTNTHVITATFDNSGNYVLKSRLNSQDDSQAITYTDVNKKLAYSKGTKFTCANNDVIEIVAYYTSLNNSISIKTTKNGEMFSPFVYAVYANGQLVLKAQTPFGTYHLYYNGDTPVAEQI